MKEKNKKKKSERSLVNILLVVLPVVGAMGFSAYVWSTNGMAEGVVFLILAFALLIVWELVHDYCEVRQIKAKRGDYSRM